MIPASKEIDPYLVAFKNPEVEQIYRQAEHERTLRLFRFAMASGVLIHLSYFVIDYLMFGERARFMWMIRVLVLIPSILLCIFASYYANFFHHAEWMTAMAAGLNGLAMAVGPHIYGAESTMYFVPGTIMVVIYSCLLLGLQFWSATFLTLGIVTAQIAFIVPMKMPASVFITAIEALIISCSLLIISSYRLAMSNRTAFLVGDLQARVAASRAERLRITRDLHDDVATRLVSITHRDQDPVSRSQAREALRALRQAIYALDDSVPKTLADALIELQALVREGLRDTPVRLSWQEPASLPPVTLSAREHINLTRVMQEAVTNALRHGRPTHLAVDIKVYDGALKLSVANDGVQSSMEDWIPGKGMANIRNRIAEIGGEARWTLTGLPASESRLCRLEITAPLGMSLL